MVTEDNVDSKIVENESTPKTTPPTSSAFSSRTKSPSLSAGGAHSEEVGTCGQREVDGDNLLRLDYRSGDDRDSDDGESTDSRDEDGFLETIEFDELGTEEDFESSEYEKRNHTEPENIGILSDLAVSLGLICLSTKNHV